MELKEALESLVKKIVLDLFSIEVTINLEHPANKEFGDYSTTVALQLAKQLQVSPRDVAVKIMDSIKATPELQEMFVSSLTIAGPGFINFTIAPEFYVNQLAKIAANPNYGVSTVGANERILIEHTSPNPNKAMHLGHMKNNITGMAIANIFEAMGYEVIRDAIDNNRGISIAKLMWGYLKFAKREGENTDINYWYTHKDEWVTPEEIGKKPEIFVDELYVKAAEDCKADKQIDATVRDFVVEWEAKNPIVWELWKLVLDYSYQGQQQTLKRLGNRWDKVWHEHEHYQKGKDFVEEGLKKGIFVKLEDGAILTNLKDYGLTDTIVIKSDGTSLYITQDLALTDLKVRTFNPKKLYWVIGPEQSLALQQMFAVCDQLGIIKREQCEHIAYGFLKVPAGGKMSSRDGNAIYIDDLIDTVKNLLLEKINREGIAPEEKDQIAEKLAIASVKYSILKFGRMTDVTFSFEDSVSLTGNSAPYLLYTVTRIKSVLKQFAGTLPKTTSYNFAQPSELELLKKISQFEETIIIAGRTLAPNTICEYLFQLAQDFSRFYDDVQILKAEETEKQGRLVLCNAVLNVFVKGLGLLGIETVDKM